MDSIRRLGDLAGKVPLDPRAHLPDEAVEESCCSWHDGVSLWSSVQPWKLTANID